jgi:serine protease inhibitor
MPPKIRKNTVALPLFAALIVISCCWIRCAQQQETETKPDGRNLKNAASTFIYNMIPPNAAAGISSEYSAAVNAFSVNLLGTIYTTGSYLGKNVVVSPFCISRNLAIITEAASGTSQKELLDALGGRAALDDARTALSRLLYADNSVILQIADAIWVDSAKYSLLPSFRDTANRKYGVEAAGLDFGNVQGSVAAMNKWIADNTADLITNAVKEDYINPMTALFVTSAIYFEADWTSPFDVTKTEPYPFSSPAGTVQVPMMTSSYRHQTRKTGDYENVKLYYGTGGRDFFYLDVYMPVGISVEEFIAEKCLAALDGKDSIGYGSLKMPKFFFENEINLIPVLKKMGVNGAFDRDKGEIRGMAFEKAAQDSARLYIDLIMHTAGIKTDEEGTVAYAVTVSGLANATAPAPVSPDVVLDRPVVYFIRAGAAGLALFAGVVNDPNEKT